MMKNMNGIGSKLWESFLSIFPIFCFVFLLSVLFVPLQMGTIGKFIVSSVFLFAGMFLFTFGAEESMVLIGESIGGSLSKSRKLLIFMVTGFLLGFVITIAEPDLAVLASQILGMNKLAFMLFVALGSGVFVLIAILRIIFQFSMKKLLAISYGIVIVLMFFTPANFLPLAFDAGGVTSGPISTPFFIAFCVGVSAVRSSKTSLEDSFGMLALASLGPILSVMVLSLFLGNPTSSAANVIPVEAVASFSEIALDFALNFASFLWEVGIIIGAILLVFFVFQAWMLKLPKTKIKRILIGVVFTYLGIVVFLTGATVGYLPLASLLGYELAIHFSQWMLFPIVVVFGLLVVIAEPAIHVLVKKIFDITGGTVSRKAIFWAIALSSAVAMVLGLAKVLFAIPFLFIMVPAYLLAVLLMFFTPSLFVSIAFDSGGVSSGTMAACFLLPFILGVQPATNSLPEEAFGIISLIAVAPLIVLQLLGIYVQYKNKRKASMTSAKHKKVEIVMFGE